MGRTAWLWTLRNRIPRPSARARVFLPPVAGIAAGVALIATGWTLLQALGAALIGLALLLARGRIQIADAWWSDPFGQVASAGRAIGRRSPSWAWPATVAALLLLAAAVLGWELMRHGELNGSTLGNLGKGVIALAMIATLALWSIERLPGRFRRRLEWWSAGVDEGEHQPAAEIEAPADT